jgi:hypothetical protein
VVTSPELSAEPISDSSLENEVPLELLDDVLPVDELSVEVLLADVLSVESSRLVSES